MTDEHIEAVADAIEQETIRRRAARGIYLVPGRGDSDAFARAAIPAAQAPLLARIAELEADNARLRQQWADLNNQVNIVDSPYDRAIKAVDAVMLDMRNRARNALRSTQ